MKGMLIIMINTTKVIFKNYEFFYNPRTFTIKRERNIVEFISPVAGSIVQDLGLGARVVTGEGELVGNDIENQYEKLNELFLSQHNGLLHIPKYKPFYAYFASLSVTAKPAPNLLTYSFKFIEDVTQKGG